MSIKNNTTNLQSLLEQVNNLPEAGGINTSDATATAEDIFLNKTAYVNNEKITGNFTIDEELSVQNELIEQILITAAEKANPTPTTCRISIDNSQNAVASYDFSYVELDKDLHYNGIVITYTAATASREFTAVTTDSCISFSVITSGAAEIWFEYNGDFEVINNSAYNLKLYIPKNSTGGTITLHASECCFIPGTQILTSLEGDKAAIETLSAGDTVVSYDINKDLMYLAKVNKLITNYNTTDIAEVYFDNENLFEYIYNSIKILSRGILSSGQFLFI